MENSRVVTALLAAVVALLLCVDATAQMTIAKAQLTTSFSYLNTAEDRINQRGFEISGGYNWLKWLTVGGDFCRYEGNGTHHQPLPSPPFPITSAPVPLNVTTYTMAAGTKFLLRKNRWVVPYVRPGLGLVHETATNRNSPVLPPGALPIATKGEWRVFYGIGGGLEIHNIVPHAAIIVLSDYLRARLFGEDRNSYRVSAGLSMLIGSKQVH